MSRIVMGPFNRVEGDLEVTLDTARGKVRAAYVNAPLYRGFEQILQGKDPMDALTLATSGEMIDLAGRMIKNKKGEVIFNFGKHRGKVVLEVLKEEPAYYDWMMQGEFPLDTKRRLTEVKLSALKMG